MIVILIIIIATNSKNNNNNNLDNNTIAYSNRINTNLKYKNDKIEIISNKLVTKGIIELTIKNKTNKELNQVVIKATCYDKDGNNLGTHSNGKYNVNTTDTYKIKIYCDYNTEKYILEIETN